MSERVPFTKGKTVEFSFNLTDPNTGLPVDASGWSGTSKIYDNYPLDGGVELASISMTAISLAFGQFKFTFSDLVTLDLLDVPMVFVCDVTESDGTLTRLVEGILFPEP